jgi:ABC-type dipeptide/oligopeptide/nickel transport system permease component
MITYFVRRTLQSVVVIFGVSVAVFLVLRISGDPAQLLLSMYATPEDIEAFRRILGLEDPLLVQYWRFLSRALRGDFGNSYLSHLPVSYLIRIHLPATIQLAVVSTAISLAIGIPAGIIIAVKRGSVTEQIVMLLALFGQSAPTFWIGIMLILVFAVQLNWLPAGTSGSWRHILLPAITLAGYTTTMVTRITHSSMVDVLQRSYVTVAHAKGLRPRAVVVRHALRNALIPVVTLVGLRFGTLLGGAVVTEVVFAWPGIGAMAVNAVYTRDYPLVQGTVFVVAVGFVLINTVLDFAYVWLDPRIRLG